MNESLYVIEDSLQRLVELREQAEAEGDSIALEAIDGQLREYLERKPEKIASYLSWIRSRKVRAANCKAEKERYAELQHKAEAEVERAKANVLFVMQRFDVKSLVDDRTGAGFRRQGNGGVQPLDIPAWPKDSSGNFKPMPDNEYVLPGIPVKLLRIPDTECIRAALAQRVQCDVCKGSGILDQERGEVTDCRHCRGKGTISATVPGAKLLPKGEHVRVI